MERRVVAIVGKLVVDVVLFGLEEVLKHLEVLLVAAGVFEDLDDEVLVVVQVPVL